MNLEKCCIVLFVRWICFWLYNCCNMSNYLIITWPPTMPCRSLTRSVWLQALLLQGATWRKSLSKSNSASWLCRKLRMFHGKSLWPSIKGTSERTCRTVSNRSRGDVRSASSPSAGRGPTLPTQVPIDSIITLTVHTPFWPPL